MADAAGNPVMAIAEETSIHVGTYRKDLMPPQLVSFTLDMDGDGLLYLNFSEPVDPFSFNASRIVFRSSPLESSAPVTHPSTRPTLPIPES